MGDILRGDRCVQYGLLCLIVGKRGYQRRVEKRAVCLIRCWSHVRVHDKWGGREMRSSHCVQAACSVELTLGRIRRQHISVLLPVERAMLAVLVLPVSPRSVQISRWWGRVVALGSRCPGRALGGRNQLRRLIKARLVLGGHKARHCARYRRRAHAAGLADDGKSIRV